MCGICGLVTLRSDRAASEETLRKMCASIRHRGPDDEGLFLEGGVALGMRRLSIIDLRSGHQPIHNEDRTIWTVFNGEIYNYPTLREELSRLGHSFYTRSDTEVLVHAYEEYGEKFVERLNGMFAFALWDKGRKRLILARDRTGIKPLYYSFKDGVLAFGSELKTLMARPEQRREVDLTSLQQYLALEHVPAPRSVIQGVNKLPAGTYLTFDAVGISIHRYWDPDLARSEASRPRTIAQCSEELVEHLREAVRLEMISDVPLGVFLSGGIDSSAVAAMMSELVPGQVKSFSIGFDDPSFDESRYAELVARHLGTEHHMMRLQPNTLVDLVPKLPDILDEPMADASIMPTYVLCRFAREHVKVALGGDGGDELLGGYSTLQAHRLTQYYRRIPGAIRHGLVEPAVNRLPVSMDNLSFDFKAKRFVRDAQQPTEIRHHLWLGNFRRNELAQLLTPGVRAELGKSDPLLPVHNYAAQCEAREELNRVLYLDMKLYMESDILVKVDRASMANSLEVRVPLLNQVFTDYVLGLPLDMKLKGFTRKFLFREAMKGKLPQEIIARKKHGFGMPVSKWLRGELKEMVQDLFSEERIKRDGLFDYSYVNTLLTNHLEGRQDNRKPLWTLLVFQLWHDRYITAAGATPSEAQCDREPTLAGV
ncbi:MAG: asparagine synthase (glutamine-hydrolyzing) [Chloroflexi bacterium]|nr:asparagine synthase (glutamine-hydrolyzing) [Chloroflexota bacterium]